MSTPYEIPLSSTPQKFSISLGGNYYYLTVKWNTFSTAWVMDIADSNDVMLAAGIPLVTGRNLLEQYRYLGLGGQLFVQTDHDTLAMPTFDNLGTQSHLYFVVA